MAEPEGPVVGAQEARRILAALPSCRLCPRLVAHREAVAADPPRRHRGETYWARPIPGFGDPRAPLWILGLAPSAQGGNRTGRMFTGDPSADFLTACLYGAGLANQPTSTHLADGLAILGVFVTATARCAPPGNRLEAAEVQACRRYLDAEFTLARTQGAPRVILVLGRVAYESACRLLKRMGEDVPRVPFGHGLSRPVGERWIVAAYHPSPQNTNTGKLTASMMEEVMRKAAMLAGLGQHPSPSRRIGGPSPL